MVGLGHVGFLASYSEDLSGRLLGVMTLSAPGSIPRETANRWRAFWMCFDRLAGSLLLLFPLCPWYTGRMP